MHATPSPPPPGNPPRPLMIAHMVILTISNFGAALLIAYMALVSPHPATPVRWVFGIIIPIFCVFRQRDVVIEYRERMVREKRE